MFIEGSRRLSPHKADMGIIGVLSLLTLDTSSMVVQDHVYFSGSTPSPFSVEAAALAALAYISSDHLVMSLLVLV